MSDFNRVQISGRYVRDPHVGDGVTLVTIASNVNIKTKEGEKAVTAFVPCVGWGKMSELMAKSKGQKVVFEGHLQTHPQTSELQLHVERALFV